MKFKQCILPDRRRLFVFVFFFCNMAFRDLRNLLLISHDDDLIDDDELLALYDLYFSKNLGFLYDSYLPFDLQELGESESVAEFRFRKRDIKALYDVLQIPRLLPVLSALFATVLKVCA